jgi:hypothetical protein
MNVSLPMHHNDIVLVGRVDLVHVAQGHINAILLTVATGGDPLKIIICPRSPPPPGLQRGDTLWAALATTSWLFVTFGDSGSPKQNCHRRIEGNAFENPL